MINWLTKKHFFLLVLLIFVVTIFFVYCKNFFSIIAKVWDFSNENSGAVQAWSTIILTFITGSYAFFTWRMEKIASKQVTADICITNKILKSHFKNKNFNLEGVNEHSFYRFYLYFDVYNRSSGAGSIEKPILILNFGGKKWLISPERKKYTGSERYSNGCMNHEERFYDDLGGTIYLKGGGFEKIELEYEFNSNIDFTNCLKENIDVLDYLIEYKNNLGNKKLVKISNIISDR